MKRNSMLAVIFCAMSCSIVAGFAQGFGGGGRGAPPPSWIEAGYDDHQNMMDQLGVKTLRPGKNGQTKAIRN